VTSLHAASDPAIAALQRRFNESLNTDQRTAVCKIMSARDYCCVIGMPGTGKTSTLSLAVQTLVAQGRSVLIASHTHSAVDTLLAKLAQDGVDVLRIGNPASVSAEVRPRCLDACIASGELPTVGHVRYRVMTAPVVGVTCLGVDGHPLFALRSFDVAICDEAGQIPEPIVLGPIRCARAFVLVGDHAQLPPLVTSSAAEAAGYGVSLLRRLAEAHPSECATLRTQYRMNAEIQSIANALVYGGQLQCATEAVATQRYRLPGAVAGAPLFSHPPYAVSTRDEAAEAASADSTLHSPPWLQRALDPTTTVLFIDTDALVGSFLSAREEWPRDHSTGAVRPAECGACACAAAAAASGCDAEGSVCNLVEARAVTAIATAVLLHGGCGRDMGVIAPFNGQTGAIRAHLAAAGKGCAGATGVPVSGQVTRELRCVEVETIDRYQGRDKDVVLFSFTRGLRWSPWADGAAAAAAVGDSARDTGRLGGVLESLPRLNVAFTRAKKKLLMVGSAATLRRGSAVCAEVLRLCEARGWVCSLPPVPRPARGATGAAAPAGASLQPHPFNVVAACYCSCGCHRL
jgi:DNA replication ATP-dependent helicase Dna2